MRTVSLSAPEVRTFAALELRAQAAPDGTYTEIRGRAVPYDEPANIGWFVETFAVGVFDKSIGEAARALPLLMFHDARTWPIGAARDWDSHGKGLDGVWDLDDSAEAQRAAQLADKGYLTGMSVGFQPIRSDYDMVDDWAPELGPDHMDKVNRLEARLVEVSLTPTPAYAGAVVDMVRSATRIPGRAAGPAQRSEVDGWRDWMTQARAAV